MPQPVFHKQFDILTDDLKKHIEEGYKIYILAEQQKQLDRLKAIMSASLNDGNDDATLNGENGGLFIGINSTLHEGFVDKGLKITRQSDHHLARDQPVAGR